MKDTLHFIIASIVDEPDHVQIFEEEQEGITQFKISVAKQDMGKVIGKEGRVIRSIRNVMKIKAMKHNVRINISLAEQPEEAAS
jgi:predicted RNA-binding protein YlqC (UPF0109 family)